MKNFLLKFKHRNIVKPAIAYIAVSWFILEASSTIFPLLDISQGVLRVMFIVMIVGFPIWILVRVIKTDKIIAQQVITFVFSDIEHSTRLAQQLRGRYPDIIERHRSIIRKIIKRYNGNDIDTAGDGIFMAFASSHSAVLAVLEIQKEFSTQKWATEIGLKVRIGVHTGIALVTETRYTGIEVHRASRICYAAHGGQVLISEVTQKSLEHGVEDKYSLHGLGKYVLKDFNEAIELFQVNHTGTKSKFPPLNIHPDEKRIAILPFTNQSENPELDYICEGLAEEIILALGKVQGLRVVSRSSAFAIKKKNLDVAQLGEKLDVSSILEGRIKRINGQLRISVELIDTDSGFDIWSGKYDNPKKDLVQIQDEITIKIADALQCTLVLEEMGIIQYRQTHIAEAYDYYLRGRRFYFQFSNSGMELALQMFEKAIKSDRTYSLAYAGIADCHSFQYQHRERSDEIIQKADEASKKAIELASALPEGYVSRGIVMALLFNFNESEKLFRYAIERDPTLFLAWFHYGRTCYAIGKLDKAAQLFEQANHVEPDDYQSLLLAAQAYDGIDCKDLAYNLRERGIEIVDKRLELNPGDTRALYLAANALVFLNQKERSIKLLNRAVALEPNDSMLLYNAGCVYALLGMESEALSCLEGSHQAGLTLRGWYEIDGNLDGLRNHPRFIKMMEQMKRA